MSILKVLVAGHDAGGLNVIAPLLRDWGKDARLTPLFLGAPAVRRDFRYRVPNVRFAPGAEDLTEWLCHRPAELDRFLGDVLAREKYDAVVCSTSAHALLERRLLSAARRSGIPSVAFCDMWWAYAERFHDGEVWSVPDRLWVIDEAMRSAAEHVAWPVKPIIDVVGSPLFAHFTRRGESAWIGPGQAIRFISEPASTSFPEAAVDEFALADMLITAVTLAGIGEPVVIRPHPADSIETWRRWAFARRSQGVSLETLPMEEAVADTHLAVGISSILLAELRMYGIPVASLQPAVADRNYFCLPFEELGIARLRDVQALAQWLAFPHREQVLQKSSVHAAAIETATRLLLELVAARPVVAR